MFQSIKKVLTSTKLLKPLVPAGAIAVIIAITLSGYEAPAYQAKAPEINQPDSKTTSNLSLPETTALPDEARTDGTPASGAIDALDAVDESDAEYEDGTYTGSAQGFGGTITVSVTIENGNIASIAIVSASGETPEYLRRAKGVIDSILNQQSTNVDVVSGATYSSNGIIQAVRNALAQASSSKSASSDSSNTDDTSNAEPSSAPAKASQVPAKLSKVDDQDALYKDGVFTGIGEGFGGDISVNVTITNGSIAKIDIVKAADETPEYFDLAKSLTTNIIKEQTTNVDTISGATYSSNGIIEAVRNALAKALIQKETSDNSSDTKSDSSGSTDQSDATESNHENTGSNQDYDSDSSDSDTKEDASTLYKPAEYLVTSTVYCDEDEDFDDYDLSMFITIKNDCISDIRLASESSISKSNLRYTNKALNGLKTAILSMNIADYDEKDDINIDAVSEATCSSDAIKDCIKKALSDAKNDL